MRKAFQTLTALVKSLGMLWALHFVSQRLRVRISKSQLPYVLRSKNAQYPLICRANSSDIFVFHQVFVRLDFALLDFEADVDLVIDCGANVGYSSAYFLTRFPNCHLIAVEPSPANFSVLEENLLPYGERVCMVRSAVWSRPTGMLLVEQAYRDGKEWSYQVRESRENETPEFFAVDIATLLRDSRRERISILKIDIEGAESVVFSENYETWLDYVDMIIIELHDDTFFGKASEVFQEVCSHKFYCSQHGELTVGKRIMLPRHDSGPVHEQAESYGHAAVS